MNKEQLKDELVFKMKVFSDKKSDLFRAYILGRKEIALQISKSIDKYLKNK